MTADVLIVGAGPAGLAAAIELRRRGAGRVVVVERERAAGGVPRHSNHTGFGLRDLHRLLTGPSYARRYAELAERAGVEIRTATTAIGWAGTTVLELTSASGRETVAARAVILATGCRERPRAARFVPGARPLGVFTTATVQQLWELHRQGVGRRAVVVGAEHVSFSAVLTLHHAGAEVACVVTEHARPQSYLPFRLLTTTRLGVPILVSTTVARILGRARVEAVELTDLKTGAVQRVACDTVVFTGDWVPDQELARRGGLVIDPGTRAPRVDLGLRTQTRGVFAAGNLLHGAETADIAALSGRHAARAAMGFLESGEWPELAPLEVICEAPLLWVSPNALSLRGQGAGLAAGRRPIGGGSGSTWFDDLGSAPHGRFILRTAELARRVRLELRQGDRVLWGKTMRRVVPNLPIYVRGGQWLERVEPGGEGLRFVVA